MFTENGRYKKSDRAESASKSIHTFKCSECSTTLELKKIEFGEKVLCPSCGGVMTKFKS